MSWFKVVVKSRNYAQQTKFVFIIGTNMEAPVPAITWLQTNVIQQVFDTGEACL